MDFCTPLTYIWPFLTKEPLEISANPKFFFDLNWRIWVRNSLENHRKFRFEPWKFGHWCFINTSMVWTDEMKVRPELFTWPWSIQNNYFDAADSISSYSPGRIMKLATTTQRFIYVILHLKGAGIVKALPAEYHYLTFLIILPPPFFSPSSCQWVETSEWKFTQHLDESWSRQLLKYRRRRDKHT